jgi:hypothetical protein
MLQYLLYLQSDKCCENAIRGYLWCLYWCPCWHTNSSIKGGLITKIFFWPLNTLLFSVINRNYLREVKYCFERFIITQLIRLKDSIILGRMVLLEEPSLNLNQATSYPYQCFLWFSSVSLENASLISSNKAWLSPSKTLFYLPFRNIFPSHLLLHNLNSDTTLLYITKNQPILHDTCVAAM